LVAVTMISSSSVSEAGTAAAARLIVELPRYRLAQADSGSAIVHARFPQLALMFVLPTRRVGGSAAEVRELSLNMLS
jgi:hypothetical protein